MASHYQSLPPEIMVTLHRIRSWNVVVAGRSYQHQKHHYRATVLAADISTFVDRVECLVIAVATTPVSRTVYWTHYYLRQTQQAYVAFAVADDTIVHLSLTMIRMRTSSIGSVLS